MRASSSTHSKDSLETKTRGVSSLPRLLSFATWRKQTGLQQANPTDVITLSPAGDPVEASPGGGPPIRAISFIAIFLIPFAAALLYFTFVASDQFTAEARFAVRSIAEQSRDNVDTDVISLSSASQDAFVVTSFIHSHELLARLASTVDYRSMFTGTTIDPLSRFSKSGSTEEFVKYWQKQVTAYIDGPSGIITLKVRAFNRNDAKILIEAILSQSEQLINELNKRAQRDMISSISEEVERTGKLYSESLTALNRFQQSSGLLSPELQANETGKLLTGLLAERLKLETRLFILKTGEVDSSPAYDQLARARESIDSQIDQLRGQLTGPEDATMANTILSFSKLETDKLVAENLYQASRRSYDAALAASLRKALYIMVFVHPTLPEETLYPKRISTPLFIGLALLVAWGTLMLLWASVEDHKL